MEAELIRVGIDDVKRFPAMTNSDCPEVYYHKTARMRTNGNGTVGCTVSHLSILNDCLYRGVDAFVMEDDLDFATDTVKRLDNAENFLNENEWDIFFLGGTYHVNPCVWHSNNGHSHIHPEMANCNCHLNRDAERTENPRIIRTYGCWCTYAYIINKDSIRKILDLSYYHMDNTYALDQLWIKLQPMLKCYAYIPAIAKQYDCISDVQGHQHQFSNFSKLGGYWWQNLETDFDPNNFDWNEAKQIKISHHE